MEIFADQIDKAAENGNSIIVMGDANLCSLKWKDEDFLHKSIADPILKIIEQCGLKEAQLGKTYLGDHVQSNGEIAESGLDHIYVTERSDNCH